MPSRRALFLLAAFVLPATILLAATLLLARQERELTARRRVEARQAATRQLGQELLVALERLRLQAAAAGSPSEPIVALGNLNREPFDFWPAAPAPQAVDVLRARDLARSGRVREANALYQQLAALPLTAVDEEGMPLAIYGAHWLRQHGAAIPASILEADYSALNPLALHAIKDLVGGADTQRVDAALARAEQLSTLQNELAGLRAAAERELTTQRAVVWLPFGPEPWLVRFGARDSVLLVASAPGVLASLQSAVANQARLSTTHATGTDALDAALPGLFAQVSDTALPLDTTPLRSRLLIAALLFATVLTLFTIYLGLRDMRREVRAAQLRSQFVASVSHELKTPLTSIRMYAEMLNMDPAIEAEQRGEYLDTIVNESERLSRLINNVLDFSRIERGEQTYRKVPLSLPSVARNVARAMEYPFRQSGLQLNVQTDPEVPDVAADRDAMEQAILNLLSNAIKYSRPGADTVDLRVERVNSCVYLRVRDYGRGIAKAEQARVFDKFYRSPDVERAGIPGTGLGLALVAHVAREHGGEVEVESEPNVGTTFSIRLPLQAI